jgi:hypothetical protein
MSSVTVIGGMRRGLQPAVAMMAATTQLQAILDLVEICIKLPIRNGTQKQAPRDPAAVTRLTA